MAENVLIATRDIYDSETGEFFRKGDPLPSDNENIFETKMRNGKRVIPGVEDVVTSTTTRVASEGRADPRAGQDGRKPAKGAGKKVAAKNEVEPKGEVEEGGAARGVAPAETGSAFE